jgi:Halocarboxylic acid dehydrogenase DehI
MAFTRAYEEHEIGPDLRRIYADIRNSLDLPFVPTPFKVLAAQPDYLRALWSDLADVIGSSEFHAASTALEEFCHSEAVSGGWRFSDQRKQLAGQHFSASDMEVMASVVSMFTKAMPQMALLARLIQLGYSGGQKGRVVSDRQASALARLITLNVPNERDSGLRTWLIYSDIKRTTGAKNVMSPLRALSSYPGYLTSVWFDAKKLMREASFARARDAVGHRARALLTGLPVGDHRRAAKKVAPNEWREIEETVDGFVRQLPQDALLMAVWQRAFPASVARIRAA